MLLTSPTVEIRVGGSCCEEGVIFEEFLRIIRLLNKTTKNKIIVSDSEIKCAVEKQDLLEEHAIECQQDQQNGTFLAVLSFVSIISIDFGLFLLVSKVPACQNRWREKQLCSSVVLRRAVV